MPSDLAARRAALAIAGRVLDRRQPLDSALDQVFENADLTRRDRGFARELATLLLRRHGSLDLTLTALLEKPLPKREATVGRALQLGLAQVLFLDVADHAAVDTTVRLVRASGRRGPHFAGLANAVLRRAVRERDGLRERIDADPAVDTPAWLWARWSEAYGTDVAAAIADSHRQTPPLDLSFRSPADKAALAQALGGDELPTGELRLRPKGPVDALPGFTEGRWWVQDVAASLPARLFGDVGGRDVADLCAAPGGKTLQLAAAGARVTAIDKSPARLALLEANLARTGLAADLITSDVLTWRPDGPFDRILLDAPCSATGTIRRHPDIPYLKSESDIATLAALQAGLLDHAYSCLAPDGILVYAVCSLEPEEGRDQIASFLDRHKDARRAPIAAFELPGLEETLTEVGDLRSLPCHLAGHGGMDGFFVARIRRR